VVSPTSHKLFLWSIDRVIRQLESPVVNRNASLGTENFEAHVAATLSPATVDSVPFTDLEFGDLGNHLPIEMKHKY
jgi:hypothetical protein